MGGHQRQLVSNGVGGGDVTIGIADEKKGTVSSYLGGGGKQKRLEKSRKGESGSAQNGPSRCNLLDLKKNGPRTRKKKKKRKKLVKIRRQGKKGLPLGTIAVRTAGNGESKGFGRPHKRHHFHG